MMLPAFKDHIKVQPTSFDHQRTMINSSPGTDETLLEKCSIGPQQSTHRQSYPRHAHPHQTPLHENGQCLRGMETRVDRLIGLLEQNESFHQTPYRSHLQAAYEKPALDHYMEGGGSLSLGGGGLRAGSSALLIDDFRAFASRKRSNQKLRSLQTRIGIAESDEGPSTVPMLLSQIPDLEQVGQCLDSYQKSCGWIHGLLDWPSFRGQIMRMLSRKQRLAHWTLGEIHRLGVLFAACGLGLWTSELVSPECCQQSGLPAQKDDQQNLARAWLRCATSALILGRYDQEPSLDSLRAMSLLTHFPLYFADEHSIENAMDLTTHTICLARQIQLHIDPDDLACCQNSTELAKDERRRLMVAILCQEFQMGGLFCKKMCLQSPRHFNLKAPNKVFEEEYGGVIARYRVGQIWQTIGITFSDGGVLPMHDWVLEMDQQLVQVESQFPVCLKTKFEAKEDSFKPPARDPLLYIFLASAHIRLHRPFLIQRDGLSLADLELHRERVSYYGRFILAIHELHEHSPLKNVSLKFFVLAASIALLIMLITDVDGGEEFETLRKQVCAVHETYQPPLDQANSIWGKSHGLLEVLLKTDQLRLMNPNCKVNHEVLKGLLH